MKNFFQNNLYARDYRQKASENCAKLSKNLALVFLVYFLISILVSVIDQITGTEEIIELGSYELVTKKTWFSSLFNLFCAGAFSISLILIQKKVYVGQNSEVSDLFEGFKDYARSFIINILQSIFIALWSLLFIVPGIIKALSYSMSYYIAIDNPQLSANECITKSREMMNGNKWNYFCLVFSYIGWIILSVLTLGILFLWVAPKMQQANYLFYLKVSGKGAQLEQEELLVSE